MAVMSQVVNFFVRGLATLFAMAAPAGGRPTLLTVINNAELEDIISGFMTNDEFILLVSQANQEARAQTRRQERRFLLRLEHGQWVYRDRVRGAGQMARD